MKRIVCSFLSIIMWAVSILPITAYANDYAQELREKGFPESYIASLVALHEKYPNWNFEVFDTDLDWQAAVNGERSYHSKQLIQKNLSDKYYCNCSKCKVNGSYVIQEGSSWVSASEQAVKYYMDPRASFDEKYIFQFESTSYDDSQTISGIESIIKGTWMHNANITYVDSSGASQTYYDEKGNTVNYSTAIMQAAKDSNMSAYYLASKIVQEVGSTTASTPGSSGTYGNYKGIYNYYNIGANTGATDGLKWASTEVAEFSTNCNANLRSAPTTSSSKVCLLQYGTTVSVVSTTEKQADGYVWYQVVVNINGVEKTGYLRSDLVGDKYGRPWTNPYLSIYYGAQWVANGFSKYQNTGYLQKFNVNKASGNLHSHEYMANVRAASSESLNTYNAYLKAGTLSASKTFYIPVFDNMPNEVCSMNTTTTTTTTTTQPTTQAPTTQAPTTTKPATTQPSKTPQVTGLTLTGTTTTTLDYSWNAVSGAERYYIYIKNNTKGTSFSKTVTTNSATLRGLTESNEYTVSVRAYTYLGWGEYSSSHTAKTNAAVTPQVTGLTLTGTENTKLHYSWNAVTGATRYYIHIRNNTKGTTFSKSVTTNSASLNGLTAGNNYTVQIKAYTNAYGWGDYSQSHTATTSGGSGSTTTVGKTPQVTGLTLTGTETTKLYYKWDAVTGATKYYIHITNNTKGTTFSKSVTTNSASLNNLTNGNIYTVKVMAYTSAGWGDYSATDTAKTGKSNTNPTSTKVSGLTLTGTEDTKLYYKWNAVSGATKYYIHITNNTKGTTFSKTVTTNSASLNNLTKGNSYTVKVKAYVNGKWCDYSDANTSSTSGGSSAIGSTAQVIGLTYTGAEKTKLFYKWNAVSGATKYYIHITNNTKGTTFSKTVTTNSASLNNLTSGNSYTVKVRAYTNAGGWGSYSTTVTDKTK